MDGWIRKCYRMTIALFLLIQRRVCSTAATSSLTICQQTPTVQTLWLTRRHTRGRAGTRTPDRPKALHLRLYSCQEFITMERISSLCNDIIENPLGSFLLSNSLSLSLFLPALTQTLFFNVCVLSQHNKIWSPYSRRDSRVLKRYWRRETPLCDRGQRRDSMSEKKRERVCQSLELMEPSFTKMLIIAVFVCVCVSFPAGSLTHTAVNRV